VATRRSIPRDGPEGFEIVFPAKRNVSGLVFITLWFGFCCLGATSAIRHLVKGENPAGGAFLVLWLLAWIVGGGWAVWIWMWLVAGREVVILRPGSLIVRIEAFGIGRTREYDLAAVKNLSVSPAYWHDVSRAGPVDYYHLSRGGQGFMGWGTLAFDYGAKRPRFGRFIDQAEATQVLGELTARHRFQGDVATKP
jgi:hypothetical protein